MSTQQHMFFCKSCQRKTVHLHNRPDKKLHVLLTMCTCGFWLLIWFLCEACAKKPECTVCGREFKKINLAQAVCMVVFFIFAGGLFLSVAFNSCSNLSVANSLMNPVSVLKSVVDVVEVRPDGSTVAEWRVAFGCRAKVPVFVRVVLVGEDASGQRVYERVLEDRVRMIPGEDRADIQRMWFQAGKFEQIDSFRAEVFKVE